jgi:hypothetical protein
MGGHDAPHNIRTGEPTNRLETNKQKENEGKKTPIRAQRKVCAEFFSDSVAVIVIIII